MRKQDRITKAVDLIDTSSQRLTRAQAVPRNRVWLAFMRREARIHLRRTLVLIWRLWRTRVDQGVDSS